MVRRILVWTGLLVIAAGAPAFAQARVEISGFAGWVFSDGVSGDATLGQMGKSTIASIRRTRPTSGSASACSPATTQRSGSCFGRQKSALVAGGTNEKEFGDMAITNYHGYFGYNWGDVDAAVRPFFFGGLGATTFGDVTGTVAGVTRTFGSETQFSTTWGAGVKIYPAPGFGLRVGMHWTPPTSSPMQADGGAIPGMAATWSATHSTPISGNSTEASLSDSK